MVRHYEKKILIPCSGQPDQAHVGPMTSMDLKLINLAFCKAY